MKSLSTRPLNDQGLGGLEAMLIVLVALVLAGVGAYVYSRQRSVSGANGQAIPTKTEGAANTASPNGIPGGTGGSSSPNGGEAASTTSTIKVTSGGFKITVNQILKDLTWHSVSANGVITTTFSTATLTKAVPACAADRGNGAFDTIQRGKGQYPGPANPSSGGLLKQYGDYYLAYVLPNAPCAQNLSVDNQNLVNQQAETFYDAISTVSGL